MNQSVLHVLEHVYLVLIFFYEPIFWLVCLYVNLSPVNIFAFLSSLKVDKKFARTKSSAKFKCVQMSANVQKCKCASVLMCKCVNLQQCKCASVQLCKYANVQACQCASLQKCKYVSVQMCKCANMQVCKSPSMQVCECESV